MTLVVETGAGLRKANALCSVSFANDYLKDRGRSEEAGWQGLGGGEKEAALIDGARYIIDAFDSRIRGNRRWFFDEIAATGVVQFTGVPATGKKLVLGDVTYLFVPALSDPAIPNEVLAGGSANDCATALCAAISADSAESGVLFGIGTEANRHATCVLDIDGDSVVLTASVGGEGGNSTVLTSDASPVSVTLTQFFGGLDGGSQPMAFPRLGLFDRDGVEVEGVPLEARQANVEYAVLSVAGTLRLVPEVDDTGAALLSKSESVGPIRESKTFAQASASTRSYKPHPRADALLARFLKPSSGVDR